MGVCSLGVQLRTDTMLRQCNLTILDRQETKSEWDEYSEYPFLEGRHIFLYIHQNHMDMCKAIRQCSLLSIPVSACLICNIQLIIPWTFCTWEIVHRSQSVYSNTPKRHLKEIGLCAQYMLIILGSIVKIIGGDIYDHLMCMRIFTLTMIKIFISAPKTTRKWLWPQLGFANHLVLILGSISYKM